MKPEEYLYDPENVKAWTMIHEHELLQEYLLHRNTNHFGQAQGTPFTTTPLNKINWTATLEHARELLENRSVHQDLDQDNPYAREILNHIAQQP
jgi:hypothetical protein